ncbi:MAG TPA: photosynthetic reaction center cytochrome c subunit family protein [Bryobacteraceae bacterium]|jgi:hypothetical protein|nr:photosynthetic reaction center cytochrome c subunit family protein [Bryobacteraceae bacterium]
MTKQFLAGFFSVGMLSAQSVNLAGVWKADLQQSTIPGPPLKEYVEIIEQKDIHVLETIGITGPHGDQRAAVAFTTDGKPTIARFNGVPSRLTAVTEGSGLSLNIETSGRPDAMHRKYELSSNGQKLTLTVDGSSNGHNVHMVYALLKQPDSAGDALRRPEAPASERFKNLKTDLKTLPASDFINHMRYYAWALNKDCEFCHVQGHFDADDKDEKRTARRMIAMVASINQSNFEGKPEVNCYTCHEFREHPQGRPHFEGEPEHQHHPEEHAANVHETAPAAH